MGCHCPVAQLVESAALIQRRPEVQSLPGQRLKRLGPCSSVARASACRVGGHGFESRRGRFCHGGPWGISSVGRAPALQAGGQGFDSPISPLAQHIGRRGRTVLQLVASESAASHAVGGSNPSASATGNSPSHGGRGVAATRWSVTSQSMGSTPSDRPNALVAQRIAHRFPGPGVAGSNPAEGTRATPPTPVAQRKERQSTKLRMGVRFSSGVLSETEAPSAISPRSSTDRAPVS